MLILLGNLGSSDRFEIRYDFRFDIRASTPAWKRHGATIAAQPGHARHVVSDLLVGLSIDEEKAAWIYRVWQGLDDGANALPAGGLSALLAVDDEGVEASTPPQTIQYAAGFNRFEDQGFTGDGVIANDVTEADLLFAKVMLMH